MTTAASCKSFMPCFRPDANQSAIRTGLKYLIRGESLTPDETYNRLCELHGDIFQRDDRTVQKGESVPSGPRFLIGDERQYAATLYRWMPEGETGNVRLTFECLTPVSPEDRNRILEEGLQLYFGIFLRLNKIECSLYPDSHSIHLFKQRQQVEVSPTPVMSDREARTRATKILAKSIYRDLEVQGFNGNQIKALASALIEEVDSQERRKRNEGEG